MTLLYLLTLQEDENVPGQCIVVFIIIFFEEDVACEGSDSSGNWNIFAWISSIVI